MRSMHQCDVPGPARANVRAQKAVVPRDVEIKRAGSETGAPSENLGRKFEPSHPPSPSYGEASVGCYEADKGVPVRAKQTAGASGHGVFEDEDEVKTKTFSLAAGSVTANVDRLKLEVADWGAAKGDTMSFTDFLESWSQPIYLLAARLALEAKDESEHQLKVLRALIADAATSRKGAYWARRITLDERRMVLEEEKLRMEKEGWIPAKAQKRRDVRQPLSDEERVAILTKVDEIMGFKPQLPRKKTEKVEPQSHGGTEKEKAEKGD